jgi:Domain of unknown function (DUF4411)
LAARSSGTGVVIAPSARRQRSNHSQQPYYPLARVPEFWEWLVHVASAGHLKVPLEMTEEIRAGDDDLAEWLSEKDHLDALKLGEEADVALVQRVITQGYAPDLDDTEIVRLGSDPFLIAYALSDIANRSVVTTEVSQPSKQRANRHIPDVCRSIGVVCMNSFELVRGLNFSTSWRSASRVW